MKYRKLGKSGIEASAVALGTWVMGGGAVWRGQVEDDDSIRTIHAAIDEGINLIDTAPAYGFGRAETVIGKAIRDRRDQVVLATKCGLLWDDDRGSYFVDLDGKPIYRSLQPHTIREEVEASLKRMAVETIDLLQTHWPSVPPVLTPISETLECLAALKAEGKIRAIGVSNVTLEELEENDQQGEISTNQPHYSMLTRDIEIDILPYCIEHNIATLAYSPLEQGLLTGKITMDSQFAPTEARSFAGMYPWLQPVNRKRVLDMLARWEDLQDKYGCNLAQLTIAWTLAQPGVTHALCGARRVDQIQDTAVAGRLDLEAADVQRMTADIDALGQPE